MALKRGTLKTKTWWTKGCFVFQAKYLIFPFLLSPLERLEAKVDVFCCQDRYQRDPAFSKTDTSREKKLHFMIGLYYLWVTSLTFTFLHQSNVMYQLLCPYCSRSTHDDKHITWMHTWKPTVNHKFCGQFDFIFMLLSPMHTPLISLIVDASL